MNIKELIRKMTLEEKASLCSGQDFWLTQGLPRLDIPPVMVSDGPHGLRKQADEADHLGLNDSIDAVCFPAACATSASFDRRLMYDMGVTLGRECQAEGVSVLLGPAVNIKRSPLCGRNFEYISEDPYVAGELAAAYINGIQSQGVGASIKHFAANNQEHQRMYGSSDLSEQALREIYFPAFETAVKKAQPWTVMCSYNRINGIYASENPWLLTRVLREEWGFEGLVMSDWGAVSNRVRGLAAGMDLEMPGSNGANDEQIVEAVRSGRLPQEQLDQAVERILNLIFRHTANRRKESFDREADHQKAADIARQCMVLLKNQQVLPLQQEERVAFIGGFAKTPRYQGGGSSHINAHRVTSPLSLASAYGTVQYAQGFYADRDERVSEWEKEALETAQQAEKIVVFAGLPDSFESEGYDRRHMRLPQCQDQLIQQLTVLGKPVVVVLQNGSPVEMPWAERVQGILEAYLGGEAVGEAVMDLLYGKANPCGKLAETFPMKLEDTPSYLNFPGTGHHTRYGEGVFVGYRYYDTKKMPVLFPFGHGLSYTTYRYDNLQISRTVCGPEEGITVSLEVTNTGHMAGKEVVQLYVSDKTGTVARPAQELKGFAGVFLRPGETKTVTMELEPRVFEWFDEENGCWRSNDGVYQLRIGSSSRSILLTAEIRHKGSPSPLPVINEDVQLGELFACEKTVGYTQEKLSQFLNAFTGGKNADEMMLQMTKYMPLRALRSFGGLTNQQISEMVKDLKKLLI